MIKILASADHHWRGDHRLCEALRIHTWMAEQVEERRPDLFLSAGDVYERASTPEERAAVAAWLMRIASVCPVVIVRGNHDKLRDLELLGQLRTRCPIVVEERAGVHVVGGVAVAACAWPSRAMIAATLRARGLDATPETVAAAGRDALRSVFLGLGDELDQHPGIPRILVAHAHLTGARVRDEGQPLPFGETVAVGVEDLALVRPDACVLGHIHLAQDVLHGGVFYGYTGSPFRTSFGEPEAKSILSLHFGHDEQGWAPIVERIPTPAAPMLLITGRMVDEDCAETGAPIRTLEVSENPEDVTGAEMRLRYEVTPEEREVGRRLAEGWRDQWIGRRASTVRLEEVVQTTTRARAPEVAQAASLEEQLRAYWRAQEGGPAEERWPRLIDRLSTIEEAA